MSSPSVYDRIGLSRLVAAVNGLPSVPIGMADGVVQTSHPLLRDARIRDVSARRGHGDLGCDNPSSPSCVHGTFVAGILVAQAEHGPAPSPCPLPGICPASELLVYPLFCEADDLQQCPEVRPSDLADGVRSLVAGGARIINLSVGPAGAAPVATSELEEAFSLAQERGVLIIAAAGNAGLAHEPSLFQHPWLVLVAACDDDGRIMPTSNRGGRIDHEGLLAPGKQLLGLGPGGSEQTMSGTSVAAAVTSGAAALLWTLYPMTTAEELRAALLAPHRGRAPAGPALLDLRRSEAYLRERTSKTITPIAQGVGMTQDRIEDPSTSDPSSAQPAEAPAIVPQACACQALPVGYAYSAGQLQVRFPDEGTEKEFDYRARQLDQSPTRDKYSILKAYPYLAERVCWVLNVDGRETAILVPKSQRELEQLIDALNPEHLDTQLVVLGALGPRAPGTLCNGLEVPLISATDFCYFTEAELRSQIQDQVVVTPPPTDQEVQQATTLLWRALGVWTTPGLKDSQRAKNFVSLRTLGIYAKFIELARKSGGEYWFSTASASVGTSEAGREIAAVNFTFQAASGRQQTYQTQIDVTGLYPFESKPLTLT
jgi:hypothetical protein